MNPYTVKEALKNQQSIIHNYSKKLNDECFNAMIKFLIDENHKIMTSDLFRKINSCFQGELLPGYKEISIFIFRYQPKS